MTERPLLILPEPTRAARARKFGGGASPAPLGQERQRQRIEPRLVELEAAFEAKRLAMQTTTAGLVPEEVLVLETAGTIEDFFDAASNVPGLEFLAEYDEDDIPPDDDFFLEKKPDERTPYRGRVYLMLANQQAFRQLLGLWTAWQRGERFQIGLTKWRDLFALLRDIRPWSIQDRLEETGVLEYWRERLDSDESLLTCEIELWFRRNAQLRNQALAGVKEHVIQLGGKVLSEALVEAIHYHALAVQLPLLAIQGMLDDELRSDVALVQCEQIQFFRASGQMATRLSVESVVPPAAFLGVPTPDRAVPPVVALFDGLPLQSHRALDGRLSVDDPDDFGADYEARHRVHGTSMASLIIWGDLHAPGDPIPQPLYVRPIMQPVPPSERGHRQSVEERVPEQVLIVDLIHRAVRRMFEGEGAEQATAPHVAVINLSLGIRDRPFEGTMSPLARLLDWLSWRYNVLFLVSAGNYGHDIDLGCPLAELGEPLQDAVVRAVAADTRNRRLLSPAEAMNVLTVGASHDDADQFSIRDGWLDPANRGYPSPVNAHGHGYKHSVKPDVLAPGGRVLLRPYTRAETRLPLPEVPYRPGQRVATPGTAGDLTAVATSRGTSNATAIMTRAAALLIPVLDELRAMEGGHRLNDLPNAVWLKALLVHGACWGTSGEEYQRILRTPENSRTLRKYLSRLLGYGSVDPDRVRACTATRVTALAGGKLVVNTGAEHRFPLPPSLSGKRGRRRLVVSLAWMTPVAPLNHRWRRAHLWFEAPQSKMTTGSEGHLQRTEAEWRAVQRGTIQHEVFEGEKAAAFVDGDEIVILVSCREDAKVLTGKVPYALAVTLEVDESIGVDIYAEVRDRVQTRLRVVERGGGGDPV